MYINLSVSLSIYLSIYVQHKESMDGQILLPCLFSVASVERGENSNTSTTSHLSLSLSSFLRHKESMESEISRLSSLCDPLVDC